jgi:NAD(P)-dependent dehydrogenase (short-subunit alcohol dehydrogenase family)
MGLLDGKVAVITGAGGGIGRAHALLFASEGAKVVVNDLGGSRDGSGAAHSAADTVVQEIRAAGGSAAPNYDSVATLEGARNIVASAVKEFGGLDIIVNNAGILRDKTLLKMDEAMFDVVIQVHLKGTWACMQAAAARMVEQGRGGRIINTSSVAGLIGNFGQSNYAAAKAGIYGLTRVGAIELRKHNITVNAVAPVAKTRLTEDLPMFQGVGEDTLGPQHIAPVALFLASDLSADLNGEVLGVAGGRISRYKMIETTGAFKQEGFWTAQEIKERWSEIAK